VCRGYGTLHIDSVLLVSGLCELVEICSSGGGD